MYVKSILVIMLSVNFVSIMYCGNNHKSGRKNTRSVTFKLPKVSKPDKKILRCRVMACPSTHSLSEQNPSRSKIALQAEWIMLQSYRALPVKFQKKINKTYKDYPIEVNFPS